MMFLFPCGSLVSSSIPSLLVCSTWARVCTDFHGKVDRYQQVFFFVVSCAHDIFVLSYDDLIINRILSTRGTNHSDS